MKTVLLILMIVFASVAWGQTSAAVLSSQPQVIRMTEHPMHAEATPMAREQSLFGGGPDTYTFAHGERPLWEFGPVSAPERPLGDVARDCRKQKQSVRKAEITLEKQGS